MWIGAGVIAVIVADIKLQSWRGFPLLALALAVTYFACREACLIASARGLNVPDQVATGLATSWVFFAHYWWVDQRDIILLLLTLWLMLACLQVVMTAVMHPAQRRSLRGLYEVGLSIALAIPLGAGFGFLPLLHKVYSFSEGPVILALATAWGVDITAYFVGKSVGSRKLWPKVSPGKTVEGFTGGLAVGMLIWGLAAKWMGFGLVKGLLGGLAAAASAQLGDLAESAYKRWAGVKDSGKIFPGHGGVLDRFDSVLFAAPVTFVLLRLLRG